MKRTIYLFLFLFLGIQISANGQILKKITKEVVKEVVKEVSTKNGKQGEVSIKKDKESSPDNEIQQGPAKGQEVVSNTATDALGEVKNFYEKSTTIKKFGEPQEWMQISPDGSHAATTGFQGSRRVLLIDGTPGPVFDKLRTDTFLFSPQGGHYAYFGDRDGNCSLVIDGKEEEVMDCEVVDYTKRSLVFSQDGSVVAYEIMTSDKLRRVVINSESGPDLQHTLGDIFVRGNDVYYIGVSPSGNGNKSGDQRFYKNNKLAHEAFARDLVMSPKGDYAFNIPSGYEEGYLVYNGKRVRGQINRQYPMDPVSGAVFYTNKNGSFVMWKDQEYMAPKGEKFVTLVDNPSFLTSRDEKQVAFCTGGTGGVRVWVNGQPGQYFDRIEEIAFTGDSGKLIYIAKTGGKFFVVVNGKEQGPYKAVEDLVVSETGPGYAYMVMDEGFNCYLNGELLDNKFRSGSFVFSPDGTRYAYLRHERPHIMIDGKPIGDTEKDVKGFQAFNSSKGQYVKEGKAYFAFSPKGNHLAYLFTDSQNLSVLNLSYKGEEVRASGVVNPEFGYPTFSADGEHFAFFKTVKGPEQARDLWQLYINMKPGPVVSQKYHVKLPGSPIRFFDNNKVQVFGLLDGQLISHTVAYK